MADRRVFLEISIGGDVKGQIVIELFDKEVPKTADNFYALCTGEGFKGSTFRSIIPGFMCHGGDGIATIYGDQFPKESTHETRLTVGGGFSAGGVLCTAHGVPDANEPYKCDSGFFITTGETPWLRHQHTMFGKVVDGYGVLNAMEQVGTRSGTTTKEVKISNCGVAVHRKV